MKKKNMGKASEEVASIVQEFQEEADSLKQEYNISELNLFVPMTKNQEILHKLYKKGYNVICDGVAGVGKTFSVLNLMLEELLNENSEYEQIVIVRSAVSTRDIGFLPGTETEKMEVFEKPYEQICNELFGKEKSSNNYKALKNSGYITFMSTSHIRGVTLRNSLILVDEVENMNYHEIKSVLTRVGSGSKIFLCGDYGQTDLIKSKHDKTGIERLKSVAEKMPSLEIVTFDKDDIVRSGFVKEFYLAEIELEEAEIKERQNKEHK